MSLSSMAIYFVFSKAPNQQVKSSCQAINETESDVRDMYDILSNEAKKFKGT